MPSLNQVIHEDSLKLRLMLYGNAKLKKTWWAAKAAEAGFNVIMVDGDDGIHILNNIEKEAQKRISVIDAIDVFDRPVMAELLTRIMRGKPFLWNETDKRYVAAVSVANPDNAHLFLDVKKLTTNDVLVVDSWTALAWSITFRFATEHTIDLADAAKTEWDGYLWSGNMSNWMLGQMAALPCHVIVIAHEQVADTYKGKKVVSSRVQPISISKNHSKLLAQKFSDILYFEIVGRQIKINTNAASNRDGGCRLVPPGVYAWESLQFKDICEKAHIPLPLNPQLTTAIQFFAPGDEIPEDLISKPLGRKPLMASAAKTEKKSLFGSLKK